MSDNASAKQKINLRDLDDVSCSNIVVSRQIRHLLKKNQSFSDIAIDCWIHGGHYTRFKYKNDKFSWYCEDGEPCEEGLQKIDSVTTDSLFNDEWNKLMVFTYRTMCDSMNGVNVEDSPEDLLALAESKLQEMLHDEDSSNKDLELLANSMFMKNPGYSGENYNNNLFHKVAGKL